MSFKGNILGPVSAVIQFPFGDGASSVAKQRYQVAVTEWQLVARCLTRMSYNLNGFANKDYKLLRMAEYVSQAAVVS